MIKNDIKFQIKWTGFVRVRDNQGEGGTLNSRTWTTVFRKNKFQKLHIKDFIIVNKRKGGLRVMSNS